MDLLTHTPADPPGLAEIAARQSRTAREAAARLARIVRAKPRTEGAHHG